MKVTTDISRKDLLKFNLRFLVTTSYMYKYCATIMFVVLAFVLWKSGIPNSIEKWTIAFAGAFGGGVAATLIYFIICIGSILVRSNTLNGTLGIHEYEIKDEGLYEKTIANETLNKWQSLGKVTIAGPYLLLQVSGFMYHIFPERCFASKEDFDSFGATIKERISDAQNLNGSDANR